MQTQDQAIENALLRKDMELLSAEVKALREDVQSLVAAWKTANYIVVGVKYISSMVAAVAMIWGAFKLYVSK